MSEKLSRILLWVEFVPLLLVTALAGVAFAVVLPDIKAVDKVTLMGLVVVAFGVVAVWRIAAGFLQGGASRLHALSLLWWSGALLGTLVALAALVLCLLPASGQYSKYGELEDFQLLVIFIPLLIPVVHLVCEVWLRRIPTPSAPDSESPAASSGAAPSNPSSDNQA